MSRPKSYAITVAVHMDQGYVGLDEIVAEASALLAPHLQSADAIYMRQADAAHSSHGVTWSVQFQTLVQVKP